MFNIVEFICMKIKIFLFISVFNRQKPDYRVGATGLPQHIFTFKIKQCYKMAKHTFPCSKFLSPGGSALGQYNI